MKNGRIRLRLYSPYDVQLKKYTGKGYQNFNSNTKYSISWSLNSNLPPPNIPKGQYKRQMVFPDFQIQPPPTPMKTNIPEYNKPSRKGEEKEGENFRFPLLRGVALPTPQLSIPFDETKDKC
jgi:hypothetical protein